MKLFLSILLTAILTNNYILSKFLGICPFLGVSKKLNTAVGMSAAVIFVMVLSSAVTYPLNTFLDNHGLGYLQTIVFILVIAALVQLVEIVLRKYIPALYNSLGIYLPLITTNCAVLGVAELVIDKAQMMSLLGISSMNLGVAVLYGLFAGVGFTVSIVIMSGLREKIDRLKMPGAMKGFPITMMAACFMAMGFYVFNMIG